MIAARAAGHEPDAESPIESFVQSDGTLRKIQHVGPSSTRVIFEVLRTGHSETVDRAVADSSRRSEVEKRRDWRSHFLSRAQVIRALRNPTLRGPAPSDYRGDLQMHSVWSDGSASLEAFIQDLHRPRV